MGVFTLRGYNLIDAVTVNSDRAENNSGSTWRYNNDRCVGTECERQRLELQQQKARTDLIIQQTILIDGVILVSGVFLFIALGKLSSPRRISHKTEVTA